MVPWQIYFNFTGVNLEVYNNTKENVFFIKRRNAFTKNSIGNFLYFLICAMNITGSLKFCSTLFYTTRYLLLIKMFTIFTNFSVVWKNGVNFTQLFAKAKTKIKAKTKTQRKLPREMNELHDDRNSK